MFLVFYSSYKTIPATLTIQDVLLIFKVTGAGNFCPRDTIFVVCVVGKVSLYCLFCLRTCMRPQRLVMEHNVIHKEALVVVVISRVWPVWGGSSDEKSDQKSRARGGPLGHGPEVASPCDFKESNS